MSFEKYDTYLNEGRKAFLDGVHEALDHGWSPPPTLSLSDWADNYRVLSREATSEYGQWHTDRIPYMREIMDSVTNPRTEEITVMKGAQVGYTEAVINNLVGYHIHQDPCPVMVVMPTLNVGAAWSKDRLDSMVRDTPVLNDALTGVSAMHKMFPGGHITIAGSNSAASLSSRPIRVLLCDEVDRYAESAGEEGDPVALAEKRTTTFWNRKKVRGGTPTIRGMSRTEELFNAGTSERYFVPCPFCDEYQRLVWAHVKWDKQGAKHLPETAHYECSKCAGKITDEHLPSMLLRGEWRSENPDAGPFHRSFHIHELYSPWVPFAKTVREFLRAKQDKQLLKVWTNTAMGETFEEDGQTVDHTSLIARRESYKAQVPIQVLTLVAGVDVQDDRFEVEVVGYNEEHESWSVDYRVYYGNPAEDELWKRLDALLLESFEHESGCRLIIDAMAIDSGHHTKKVYDYCATRWSRRVYALKGVSGFGRPSVGRPSRNNRHRVRLFSVGVDTLKLLIYGYLSVTDPGPGYCHFPLLPKYNAEHFQQLTSEKLVREFRLGNVTRKWVKVIPRNEQLDCRVYTEAALELLAPAWHTFKERILQGGVRFSRADVAALSDANAPHPLRQGKERKERKVLNRGFDIGSIL